MCGILGDRPSVTAGLRMVCETAGGGAANACHRVWCVMRGDVHYGHKDYKCHFYALGRLGEKVVDECEEKISRLKVKNARTVRPVLVYDGDLSRRVPADAFFSFIVSSDDLIGRSAAGAVDGV